jgi:hypothetical protein
MSTVAEIEEALPLLTSEDLDRVEAALQRARASQGKTAAANPRLEAFYALKDSLALTDESVAEWKAAIQDSRR